MLVAPKAGFEAAARSTQRRARLGDTPAEGYAPYVLSALGGASAMFLWLKVSVLAGLRADSTVTFRWSFLVAAGVLGAILGLAAQFVWGASGAPVIRRVGGEVTPREIRMVWGASAFPLVFGLVFLVPLDLLIVGPSAFTSEKLSDSVASAWAALSIAIAFSLMLWSLYLFVKGVSVVSGIRFREAFVASFAAFVCLALVVVAFRFGALALTGGS